MLTISHLLLYQTVRLHSTQTVIGAGKMLLESGLHPGALKDNVCSPGGTTIRGIRAMEDAGVRAAMIDAIDAASHNA